MLILYEWEKNIQKIRYFPCDIDAETKIFHLFRNSIASLHKKSCPFGHSEDQYVDLGVRINADFLFGHSERNLGG